jgi:hypothetical protein
VSLRLVPLDCPACGSAMSAAPEDEVFLCAHCGGGAVLGPDGLGTVDAVALLPTPGRRADAWRPGWALDVNVTVARRTTADGRSTPDWSAHRTFLLPAFELGLADLVQLGRALSRVPDATGEVPRQPLPGGRLSLSDALVLVRHLVIAEEVARPDMLASLEVAVEELGHRLVALPFTTEGDVLRCAVTGVAVAAGP